jgi:hypothetical protein
MYAYWSDINLKQATVRVSHKPDRGWTPKAYKEWEIPIPSNLVESVTEWKSKAKKGFGDYAFDSDTNVLQWSEHCSRTNNCGKLGRCQKPTEPM